MNHFSHLYKSGLKMAVIVFLGAFTPLFIVNCSNDSSETSSAPAQQAAFITTTDFSTGSFTVITLDDPRTASENLGDICSDAIVRVWNGLVYVVERFGCDSIKVLDPQKNYTVIAEYSVGAGSNPQDIVVVDNKAYVSRYASNSLLIIDPADGTELGQIDVSDYADADGYPEMALMYYQPSSGYLFLALQRLDTTTWTNESPSYVLVIDTTTDTIKKAIALKGLNPFSDFRLNADGNKLLISCTGSWGVLDGGIEAIDLPTLESQGFIATESTLGGDVLDVAVSASQAYALIADPNFITSLVSFDAQNGAPESTMAKAEGYDYNKIEINDRGELWLLDRTATAPAVHIYDSSTNTEQDTIQLSGLPPFWMAFL